MQKLTKKQKNSLAGGMIATFAGGAIAGYLLCKCKIEVPLEKVVNVFVIYTVGIPQVYNPYTILISADKNICVKQSTPYWLPASNDFISVPIGKYYLFIYNTWEYGDYIDTGCDLELQKPFKEWQIVKTPLGGIEAYHSPPSEYVIKFDYRYRHFKQIWMDRYKKLAGVCKTISKDTKVIEVI